MAEENKSTELGLLDAALEQSADVERALQSIADNESGSPNVQAALSTLESAIYNLKQLRPYVVLLTNQRSEMLQKRNEIEHPATFDERQYPRSQWMREKESGKTTMDYRDWLATKVDED